MLLTMLTTQAECHANDILWKVYGTQIIQPSCLKSTWDLKIIHLTVSCVIFLINRCVLLNSLKNVLRSLFTRL